MLSAFSQKLVQFLACPLGLSESRFCISDFGNTTESFLVLIPKVTLPPRAEFLPS